MYHIQESKLVNYGIGIKTSTYFKIIFIYIAYAEYGVIHTAIWGMN